MFGDESQVVTHKSVCETHAVSQTAKAVHLMHFSHGWCFSKKRLTKTRGWTERRIEFVPQNTLIHIRRLCDWLVSKSIVTSSNCLLILPMFPRYSTFWPKVLNSTHSEYAWKIFKPARNTGPVSFACLTGITHVKRNLHCKLNKKIGAIWIVQVIVWNRLR